MSTAGALVTDAAVYLDASALVKLFRTETESNALQSFMADHPRQVSSALVVTEVLRAAARAGDRSSQLMDEAQAVVDRIILYDVSRDILRAAGGLHPLLLRSLDAIHLATALTTRPNLDGVVTYDDRLADAARHHELRVYTPGR